MLPVELIEGAAPRGDGAHLYRRARPPELRRPAAARRCRHASSAARSGLSGANLDYLISTLRHLAELGIRERELERLLAMIGPHAARIPGTAA